MRIYLREDNENMNGVLKIYGAHVDKCLDDTVEFVKIPDGIECIDGEAFRQCSISEVEFPDGLKKISFNAFEGCEFLTEITIPTSVQLVDAAAFTECYSLEKVNILSADTEISFSAFYGEEDTVTMYCEGFDFTMEDVRRTFTQYNWDCDDIYDDEDIWYGSFYPRDVIAGRLKRRKQDAQDIANGIRSDSMIEDENDFGF